MAPYGYNRNPVLSLEAVHRLRALPAPLRGELSALLRELASQADALAEKSWRRRKGPMAAYWRAVAVYARHIARAITRA